jgi:hypothetical protein
LSANSPPPFVSLNLVENSVQCRLAGGQFDRAFAKSYRRLPEFSERLELQTLARRLRARGVKIYFANHFFQVAFPELKTVAWAHDITPKLFPGFFMPDALAHFSYVVENFS